MGSLSFSRSDGASHHRTSFGFSRFRLCERTTFELVLVPTGWHLTRSIENVAIKCGNSGTANESVNENLNG
jgi:hypothetical protein